MCASYMIIICVDFKKLYYSIICSNDYSQSRLLQNIPLFVFYFRLNLIITEDVSKFFFKKAVFEYILL